MGTHEHDGASDGPNTPEEERTARICAYLLGELPADESTLVEAELAANPELQAEADLLAATIGIVQSGLRTEPALPAEALESLAAAAAQPLQQAQPAGRVVQGRFSTQSATKAAAAVLVLMGGSLLYLQSQVEKEGRALEVASSEDPGLLDGPEQQDVGLRGSEIAQPGTTVFDLDASRTTGESLKADDRAAAGAAGNQQKRPVIHIPPTGEMIGKRKTYYAAESTDGLRDPYSEVKRFLTNAAGEVKAGSAESARSIERQFGESHSIQFAASEATRPQIREFRGGRGLTTETATRGTGTYRGPGDSAPPSGGAAVLAGQQAPPLPRSQDAVHLPDYWRAAGTAAPGEKAEFEVRVAELQEELELEMIGVSAGLKDGPSTPGPGDFYLGRGERLKKLQEHRVPWLNKVPVLTELTQGKGADISQARKLRDAQALAEQYLQRCRPLPGEQPRDMYFRYWGDNPYVYSSQDALATFAADVDTASYNLARRYLVEGKLPTKAQVRTEEFVNAFQPDVPAPAEGTFAVQTELAPSPFGGSEARWMLRVTVRGKEVARDERDPLALTFVVDTSGSMKEDQRLELVKHALRLLVAQLEARDSIAVVAFADEARLVLPMTPVGNRAAIEAAIHPLAPKGGTNAEAGLILGYELAASALSAGVHHRVVFLSDGVANIGQTDQDQLSAAVQHRRDQGIYLNTIGVGMSNHNDVFLEQLADKGDGICDYVDDGAAVERAIVERFTGAFVPIASDVKIQVEFDRSQVLRWRQIGYENRAVADADFRNDAVDAGEIGAGHQVTALFELERVGAVATNMVPTKPLAEVRLRWKQPKGAGIDPNETKVFETDHAVTAGSSVGHFASASPGYQRAVLASQFAEFLRQSSHAASDSIASLVAELERIDDLPGLAGDQDTVELLQLVKTAAVLGAGQRPQLDALGQTVDEYQRHLYLNAQLREARASIDDEQQAQLKATNDALEQRIRELCLEQSLR